MPTPAAPPLLARRPAVWHAARAVGRKLRLLSAFGTFWPAVARGGRLLLRGRVREFVGKLFNELDGPPRPAGPRSGPPLFLAGHVLGTGGYDQVVYALLEGLTAAGVHLHRDPRALFKKDLVPADLWPSEGVRRRGEPRLVVVPPHLLHRFKPDRRTAVFTMWETDTLPRGAVRRLNRAALVVVPSHWGEACFRADGVTAPVEVVPLGHDPAVFRPAAGGAGGAGGRCVFGTAGALDQGGVRKNVQRVVDLFREAFPVQADVALRVKITPASPPVDARGDPRVEVLSRPLTPAALADWYRSLTAYVNASFGEGFGLHLLEAMACGRPLVSTRFGGAGEFFDRRFGYEVGYTAVPAGMAMYRGCGHWGDPDDGALVRALRRVYADRGEARDLGEAAAGRAARFTWDDTVRKLVIVLIRHGFIRP